MTDAAIEALIARQATLLAALDSGDVAAVEAATAAMATALSALRADATPVTEISGDRIGYALRQCDAARTRVNYLADRTRQKIDRLSAHRGGFSPTYNSAAILGAARR